jgi:hypothetical protein
MVNMCCTDSEIGSGTHGSLHDPNFSLEEGDETHDDLYRVPESGV